MMVNLACQRRSHFQGLSSPETENRPPPERETRVVEEPEAGLDDVDDVVFGIPDAPEPVAEPLVVSEPGSSDPPPVVDSEPTEAEPETATQPTQEKSAKAKPKPARPRSAKTPARPQPRSSRPAPRPAPPSSDFEP